MDPFIPNTWQPRINIVCPHAFIQLRCCLDASIKGRHQRLAYARRSPRALTMSLNEKTSAPSLSVEAESLLLEIDPVAERKLVRKLDWSLLPLFTLLYVTNFVDRTAIGNAKIAGIERDLHMKGYDFNVALTVFYIFYMVSEIPSNLVLKRYGSVWLSFTVVAFGVVSIATAFVQNFAGLVVTRVFLGMAEGGTLAGLTYIISRYYRRRELVMRIGIFFGVSAPLGGAFGGLLASGLLSVDSIGSVTSWRKIFLVEGVITTGVGILGFWIIPTDPVHTKMLTEEERALALARISADQAVSTDGKKERTSLSLVLRSFNIHTTFCALCYFLVNISFQGLALFMPTVIATLGKFTVVQSQLRTVPPYIVSVFWTLFISWVALRYRTHGVTIGVSAVFQIVGYAVFVGTKNSDARYAACFLALFATPIGPLSLAWATANAAPDTMRAVTSATVPGVGAFGAILAVWTYLPSDAPNYHNGNILNLSTASCILTLAILASLYIRWENAKRDRGERDSRVKGLDEEQQRQLGYRHPKFMRVVPSCIADCLIPFAGISTSTL
ncbi:MFS general substrate transporter [Mycena kentingensis (nom. inval.)]|nr:MFS general substrate transporter [Mycena kentingensis (nom. inval.)]